ncbi:MAG: ResB-like domain protein [Niabella sp.]|nr:MAG: ResB-like domain protein [Niabella sp.]
MNLNIQLHKKEHYKYSVLITVGLLLTGLVLQFFKGAIPKEWFSFPNNIWCGIVFISVFTTLYLLFKNREFFNLLSSVPFALVASITLGLLTIGLGSIHIDSNKTDPNSFAFKLGLDSITTTWYFGFMLMLVLINLWFATLKRALVFQTKNISFLLNHFGLWLTLFAGVLGQGDLSRLTMTLKTDQPEWRATDADGHIVELPIALELKKFKIDIYPNKLYVINKEGNALPNKKPHSFLLEKENESQVLLNWKITLNKYIENAVPDTDSSFTSNPMWGATNAAHVSVEHLHSSKKVSQWIAAGNFKFSPMTIQLDSNHTLVMAPAEAKRFESEVLVFEKDKTGGRKELIQVNHPIKAKDWKIYQVSYDEKLGRWSDVSIVELILDPWLPLVYTGVFLLMAGTIAFLFKNRK